MQQQVKHSKEKIANLSNSSQGRLVLSSRGCECWSVFSSTSYPQAAAAKCTHVTRYHTENRNNILTANNMPTIVTTEYREHTYSTAWVLDPLSLLVQPVAIGNHNKGTSFPTGMLLANFVLVGDCSSQNNFTQLMVFTGTFHNASTLCVFLSRFLM